MLRTDAWILVLWAAVAGCGAEGEERGATTTSSETSTAEASSCDQSTGDASEGSGTEAPDADFADVASLFSDKCGPCHVSASLGGHDIGAPDLNAAFADSQLPAASADCDGLTKGACTLVRIQSGSMPMGFGCTGDPQDDAGNDRCFTVDEQALLESWIDGGQASP